MKITLITQGGFAPMPGLQRPITVSMRDLAPAQQNELCHLIDALDFFKLPAQMDPPARGAADYRTYVITVEAQHHTHSVTVTDPVKDERMRRLIQLLRSQKAQ